MKGRLRIGLLAKLRVTLLLASLGITAAFTRSRILTVPIECFFSPIPKGCSLGQGQKLNTITTNTRRLRTIFSVFSWTTLTSFFKRSSPRNPSSRTIRPSKPLTLQSTCCRRWNVACSRSTIRPTIELPTRLKPWSGLKLSFSSSKLKS